MNGKKWSEEEDDIIRVHFPDKYTEELCVMLNRSYSSVSNRSYLLGVHKSDDFKALLLEKQKKQLEQGAAYRFPKGNVPANKGKKMSPEHYEKTKRTMFKKGQVPHNTKYDGHERININGYTEVRTRIGKYELKHRLIWQEHKGEIPKDSIVVFKDGNKRNMQIDNLELITKIENMQRNTIHKYPKELKPTKILINKINKRIKENEKQIKRPK